MNSILRRRTFFSSIVAVEEYERFVIPKRRVFTDWYALKSPSLYRSFFSFSADVNDEVSLDEHLRNQQAFIQGRDAYIYKYIPRVRFELSFLDSLQSFESRLFSYVLLD